MFKRDPLREMRSHVGTPLPPHCCERLDWRAFCKKYLQNIESKRVKVKNIEGKRVAAFSGNLSHAASALTIIYSFRGEGQGQRSHEAVGRRRTRKKGRPDIGRHPRIRSLQSLSWRSAIAFLPTKRVYACLISQVWYRTSLTLPRKRARLPFCHRRSNACGRQELGGTLPVPHAFRRRHLYRDKRL